MDNFFSTYRQEEPTVLNYFADGPGRENSSHKGDCDNNKNNTTYLTLGTSHALP